MVNSREMVSGNGNVLGSVGGRGMGIGAGFFAGIHVDLDIWQVEHPLMLLGGG